jgi:Bifunctional DNA primase/polymerase, N-terminal
MANQTERVDHLAAALRYAAQGVPVFPLAPRSKVPLISAANDGHGLHDATTDAARSQAWWMAHPTANIGLRLVGTGALDHDETSAALIAEGLRLGLGAIEAQRARWPAVSVQGWSSPGRLSIG